MASVGMKYRLNKKEPKFSSKSLVAEDQERKIIEKKLSFSFSYFKHDVKYFQIGDCHQRWFVGLIERLVTLCDMTKDGILMENAGSIALRCHEIDWTQKNIPIQRKDLTWLPPEILSNDKEFPIMQVSISKSTGRIIGFFDSDPRIFNIILLDPNHNIQPCKKNNYQIQPTTQGVSQYDELLNRLDRIKHITRICPDGRCQLHSHIQHIDGLHDYIMYMGVDKRLYDEYQELLQRMTLTEIFERGIIDCLANS